MKHFGFDIPETKEERKEWWDTHKKKIGKRLLQLAGSATLLFLGVAAGKGLKRNDNLIDDSGNDPFLSEPENETGYDDGFTDEHPEEDEHQNETNEEDDAE